MKKDFNSRLVYLSDKLNSSYDKNYSSNEDEYIESKKIKSEIVGFILDAHACGETVFVERAFKLLVEHTGCQEDVEILEEILSPVIKKKIIDSQLLERHLKDSPLSRWL